MLISQAIFSTGWKYLKSKPSYNKVLQCSLCLLAPPPAKVSGSHQNTSDYAGTVEWAQLDLQSIQHRDYFGHLSIFPNCFWWFRTSFQIQKLNLKIFLMCRSLGNKNVWGSKLSDRQTILHLAKKRVIVWFVLPSIYKVCQELLALTPASILEFEIDWKGPGPIL